MSGEKFSLILERQNADSVQTLGTMYVVNEGDRIQYKCWALELPPRKNKKMISSIPIGSYDVVKRWSKKYGNHLYIKDVKNRSFILIHSGNTYLHTKGCILVGNDLGFVNQDEHLDVLNSKVTLKKLLELLPEKTRIMIVENEHEDAVTLKKVVK
jgi:hypothetical protein